MAFHQYNKVQYNTAQYNADAFSLVVAPTETVGSADARIDRPNKVLADSLTSTDSRAMAAIRLLAEFVFLTEGLIQFIESKGFTETVRVNDWVEIERKNQNNGNGWSN